MAVTAYGKLFKRAAALRLSHPTLYTCYNNRAGAYLKLGLFDEALLDAERGRDLAQESFKRCVIAQRMTFHTSTEIVCASSYSLEILTTYILDMDTFRSKDTRIRAAKSSQI